MPLPKLVLPVWSWAPVCRASVRAGRSALTFYRAARLLRVARSRRRMRSQGALSSHSGVGRPLRRPDRHVVVKLLGVVNVAATPRTAVTADIGGVDKEASRPECFRERMETAAGCGRTMDRDND